MNKRSFMLVGWKRMLLGMAVIAVALIGGAAFPPLYVLIPVGMILFVHPFDGEKGRIEGATDLTLDCSVCGGTQSAVLATVTHKMEFFLGYWGIPLAKDHFLVCERCAAEKRGDVAALIGSGAVGCRKLTKDEYGAIKRDHIRR